MEAIGSLCWPHRAVDWLRLQPCVNNDIHSEVPNGPSLSWFSLLSDGGKTKSMMHLKHGPQGPHNSAVPGTLKEPNRKTTIVTTIYKHSELLKRGKKVRSSLQF